MFGYRHADLNRFNRPVRTRMPGGVGGDRPVTGRPYPDYAIDAVWKVWTHSIFITVSVVIEPTTQSRREKLRSNTLAVRSGAAQYALMP
jgi:hypothetical protein